jgi:hypothetical protein
VIPFVVVHRFRAPSFVASVPVSIVGTAAGVPKQVELSGIVLKGSYLLLFLQGNL